jgi:hypothetical protein
MVKIKYSSWCTIFEIQRPVELAWVEACDRKEGIALCWAEGNIALVVCIVINGTASGTGILLSTNHKYRVRRSGSFIQNQGFTPSPITRTHTSLIHTPLSAVSVSLVHTLTPSLTYGYYSLTLTLTLSQGQEARGFEG